MAAVVGTVSWAFRQTIISPIKAIIGHRERKETKEILRNQAQGRYSEIRVGKIRDGLAAAEEVLKQQSNRPALNGNGGQRSFTRSAPTFWVERNTKAIQTVFPGLNVDEASSAAVKAVNALYNALTGRDVMVDGNEIDIRLSPQAAASVGRAQADFGGDNIVGSGLQERNVTQAVAAISIADGGATNLAS